MANEYATLAQLRRRARVSDPSEDTELSERLTAASRQVDRDTGRRYWLDSVASSRVINPLGRVVAERDGEVLLVPDIGSSTGLVVEVGSGSSWSALTVGTDVELQPTDALDEDEPVTALLRSWGRWTASPVSRVRVTALWGWPAVPAGITEATLLMALRLYRRRDSPEGLAGAGELGVATVLSYDSDYTRSVRPFVRQEFG